MGGQIRRIDNLPYKGFTIPVLPCIIPKDSYIGDIILAMESGEHLSSGKESELLRRQSIDIHRNPPPVPGSTSIS